MIRMLSNKVIGVTLLLLQQDTFYEVGSYASDGNEDL